MTDPTTTSWLNALAFVTGYAAGALTPALRHELAKWFARKLSISSSADQASWLRSDRRHQGLDPREIFIPFDPGRHISFGYQPRRQGGTSNPPPEEP